MGKHYVPQYYLKGFSQNNGKYIWVYDKKDGVKFPTQVKSIANITGFYSKEVERYLANTIESSQKDAALMINPAIFCADVGSIKQNKFGWAALLPDGYELLGTNIEEFASEIVKQINKKVKVAIGFECPLFVPVRCDPILVNSARKGEGNRCWSAAAGTGALATGLVEALWVMNEVSRKLGKRPKAVFQWHHFVNSETIFLWEAFVTSNAKGAGHAQDALIAATHFRASLPDPTMVNAIEEKDVFSLIGAAALRAGWAYDVSVLSEQCLVIKASKCIGRLPAAADPQRVRLTLRAEEKEIKNGN